MHEGEREICVYLPAGASWTNVWTGEVFAGGTEVVVDAPLDQIPLFARNGFDLLR